MLFQGRTKIVNFQHLLQKVDNRLLGWNTKLLSMAGHLTLIRHVLTSLPLHVFAALDPPKTLVATIQQRFASFLWSGNSGQHRRHWCSRNGISKPVQENGLAVRGLEDIAASFACKKWWKLVRGHGIWASYVNFFSRKCLGL